jgi:5'-phosphate synthase pdxT subunit
MDDNEGPLSPRRGKRIAVLALQGDYEAHRRAVESAGGAAFLARTPEDVEAADAVILPGGESTTIGKLLARYELDAAIRRAHAAGKPVFGTCAGMILLAKGITRGEKKGGQPTLGLMDVRVARNAFGRQLDSFEADLAAPRVTGDGADPLRAVFIRAPYIEETGTGVDVLATIDGKIVLAREGNLLAAAFHPELTGDTRVHRYFLDMVSGDGKKGDTRP